MYMIPPSITSNAPTIPPTIPPIVLPLLLCTGEPEEESVTGLEVGLGIKVVWEVIGGVYCGDLPIVDAGLDDEVVDNTIDGKDVTLEKEGRDERRENEEEMATEEVASYAAFVKLVELIIAEGREGVSRN